MSKSTRTQQCYAVAFRGQGKLTRFRFKAPAYSPRVHGTKLAGKRTSSPVVEPDQQPIAQPPPQPEPSLPTLELSRPSQVRSASVLSDPPTDNDEETRSGLGDVAENGETEAKKMEGAAEPADEIDEIEDCEDEIEEGVQDKTSHVCDWTDLQKQIKDHLKENSTTLPLSQVNQFLIISNFATL